MGMGAQVLARPKHAAMEQSSRSSLSSVAGRTRPGSKEADRQTAFRTLSRRFQEGEPAQQSLTAAPQPLLRRCFGGRVRERQAPLLGWVSAFPPVPAWANPSTLVWGRSTSRLHQLGIRQAVGARLSQLLTPLVCDFVAIPILPWRCAVASSGGPVGGTRLRRGRAGAPGSIHPAMIRSAQTWERFTPRKNANIHNRYGGSHGIV